MAMANLNYNSVWEQDRLVQSTLGTTLETRQTNTDSAKLANQILKNGLAMM